MSTRRQGNARQPQREGGSYDDNGCVGGNYCERDTGTCWHRGKIKKYRFQPSLCQRPQLSEAGGGLQSPYAHA